MKALRLYAPYDLRLEDIQEPKPKHGWILAKTIAAGICGTDKAFYRGTYRIPRVPLIPGHECVGVVVEGPEDLLGKVIVPEINFACGECGFCRMGLYIHCPRRRTLGIDFDGCMAEYFTAPLNYIHEIPGDDPIKYVAVEPLAAVLNAIKQYPPIPGMKVAVLGSGNLAILTAQVLDIMGIDYVVVVRGDTPKIKYLKALDVEYVTLDEIMDYVKKRTFEGTGFDMVFETTGSNEGLELAIKITRPRGVIHLKSTPGGIASFNQTVAVVKEIRIIGSRCGSFREFRKAIELIRDGVVKPIITYMAPLDRGIDAFRRSFERDQVKVVVKT